MASAQLAASHFEPDGYGDARKFLINYYMEPNGGDPTRSVRLVNTPGSVLLDNGSTLTTAVRGLFQADGFAGGKLVVPDGVTVRLYDVSLASWTALSGSISGTDRVRVAFGGAETAVLAGGAYYVATASAVAAASDADWATLLSDAGVSAFTSVATLGQRALLTYKNRFGFSASLNFNATTTISYYVGESDPDDIVAGVVSANRYYLFGNKTIEPWVQTGDNDDPFSPLVGAVVQRGCIGRDTIVELDNALHFIGENRVPYRLNDITPIALNPEDPWVTRVLQATAASDIVCASEEADGHSQYIIRTPTKCMVYDIGSQTWHLRQSYGQESWDWLFHVAIDGKHYAAPNDTVLVELSRSYASDRMPDASTFGTEIVGYNSGHLPVNMGNVPLGQIRLEGAKGVGLPTGQGSNPVVSLAISRDKGNTFGPWRDRSIGAIGEYGARTSWEQNGRAEPEQTVLLFRISDPVRRLWSRIAIGER